MVQNETLSSCQRIEPREMEAWYRCLAAATGEAVYVLDLEGRISDSNHVGRTLLGYTEDELLGLRLDTLVASGFEGRPWRARRTCDADERVEVHEIEFIDANGAPVPVEVRVLPIVVDGEARRMLLVARDLRWWRSTEHMLQERNKELSCLHRTCEVLARGLPRDVTLQAIVDEVQRAVQYPAEVFAEIVVEGRGFVAGEHAEIGDRLEVDIVGAGEIVGRVGVYRRGVANGKTASAWSSVGGQSLGYFLVEEREMLDAVARYVGSWLERLQTAEALRLSEARARAVFNALPLATAVWRRCGERDIELIELNETTELAFGVDTRSMVGMRGSELLETNPRVQAMLLRCLRTRQPQRDEFNIFEHPDTEPRRLVLHSVFVEPDLVVSYGEDVTEQRRVEGQLWQAQKMEAVGQLAGGVAHDLNNLLAVIGCSAELALASLADDAPAHEDVGEIMLAVERAAELIRKLLAFGRRQVLEPVLLDLDGVVTDVSTMIRRLLGECVELDLDVGASVVPLTVRADPGQIEQVLMNLALNANDAMPTGGHLRLATRPVAAAEARTLGLRPGAWVELLCRDTGCGMDEETRQRIFEPFFTTKAVGRGTGLGMSSVYGIVTQSEGHIVVDSAPGAGTQVRVYLPRVAQAGVRRPASNPQGCERGSGRIMLVEDNESVRRLVARMLRRVGYEVVVAASAREALTRIEAEPDGFELLLTDVVMPEMTGPALVEAIRWWQPELRVLYMSGHSPEELRIGEQLDAHIQFIAKPFTGAQVAHVVSELIAT